MGFVPSLVILFGIAFGAANDELFIDAHLAHLDDAHSYLRVQLQAPNDDTSSGFHPYTNVVFLVDKSGSMGGSPIEDARQAIRVGLERLEHRSDFSAIVSFSSEARVEQSWTSNHHETRASMEKVYADGGTNMYEGLRRAISMAKEQHSKSSVTRIILLSDGHANTGPSSTKALADLAREAASYGITISTVGLGSGFNEDLLTAIAAASDGNHYFAQNTALLSKIMDDELSVSKTVYATDIDVRVNCGSGDAHNRVRLLAFESGTHGATAHYGSLYRGQKRNAMFEIRESNQLPLAVSISYCLAGARDCTVRTVQVTPTSDKELSNVILAEAIIAIHTIDNKIAIQERDAGHVENAKAHLRKEAETLNHYASLFGGAGGDMLKRKASTVQRDEEEMSASDSVWNVQRKTMYASAYQESTNQLKRTSS